MRKRVPCTIDPSHSVYLFDLEKHVKICNKKKALDRIQSHPYFTLNINSGTSDQRVDAQENGNLYNMLVRA